MRDEIMAWTVTSSLIALVELGAGLGLLWFAPSIAKRFYADDPVSQAHPGRLDPGEIYHIACAILGLYLLVSAAEPLGRCISGQLSAAELFYVGNSVLAEGFTATVYIAAGLVLYFGAGRVGQAMSGLRYAPEKIPKQQVSLSFLLGLTIFFAILLGVVKFIAS